MSLFAEHEALETMAKEVLRLRDLIAKQEPHWKAGNECATCSKMNLEGMATNAAIKFAEHFLKYNIVREVS